MAAPIIGFHLDLKYIMPRKDYLLSRFLPELAGCGINAILMEYEDKFPFRKHSYLPAPGAFTGPELKAFLAKARDLGITPIPLVQTLAHLEFALSHEKLAHLREMPDIHTHICPSNPQAVAFVDSLLQEVLSFHQEDPYFHMGADETHFVGVCPRCKERFAKLGKIGFWAEHLKGRIALAHQAGKRPIVWDDIFWPQPQAVAQAGLPKDVILASWDYSIRRELSSGKFRSYNPSSSGEFGSAESANVFRERLRCYRAAGHDVLTTPCLNWGVLAPMRSHSLENTAAWAKMGEDAGGLGMINSAWQSFHTPLPTYNFLIAATGALGALPPKHVDQVFELEYYHNHFGAAPAGLPQAMEDLGTMWEQKVNTNLGRPLTVIAYGYMDMVLWWPTFEQRNKRGGYPRDWDEIDFIGLTRKKMQLLRDEVDRALMQRELSRRQAGLASAYDVLQDLALRATHNLDEALLLAQFAQLKLFYCELVRLEVFGQGNRAELAQRIAKLGPILAQTLSHFIEAASLPRLLRAWVEPAQALCAPAAVPA